MPLVLVVIPHVQTTLLSKLRDVLDLDYIPGGISPTGDDNIVFDIAPDSNGHQKSTSGWGHPLCAESALSIAEELPTTHPVG